MAQKGESVPDHPLQLLKIAIDIVDLPSYKMVIFHSYVSLPEAISHFQTHTQVAMFRVTALGNEEEKQKTV